MTTSNCIIKKGSLILIERFLIVIFQINCFCCYNFSPKPGAILVPPSNYQFYYSNSSICFSCLLARYCWRNANIGNYTNEQATIIGNFLAINCCLTPTSFGNSLAKELLYQKLFSQILDLESLLCQELRKNNSFGPTGAGARKKCLWIALN